MSSNKEDVRQLTTPAARENLSMRLQQISDRNRHEFDCDCLMCGQYTFKK